MRCRRSANHAWHFSTGQSASYVASVQLDRPDGVGFFDRFAPPGPLSDRHRRIVTGEGLVDDGAQDDRLGPTALNTVGRATPASAAMSSIDVATYP